MAKQSIEDENKVVSFEEAAATTKKRTSRKKAAVVEEPKTVAKEKTADIEKEMNQPEKLTFAELIEAVKDFETFKDVAMFMVSHHVVERKYVDYREVYAAATTAVNESQYVDGKFVRNLPLLTVFTTVATFYLFTNMDFGDMSVTEVYDAISQFNLLHAVEGIAGTTFGSGNVMRYATAIIDDIDYNERSTAAMITALIEGISEAIGEQSNEDVAKAVVGELVEKAKEME